MLPLQESGFSMHKVYRVHTERGEDMNIKGRLYRLIMKIAHKYHWHYAPPIYPEGDTQLWCKWCGFRATIQSHEKLNKVS